MSELKPGDRVCILCGLNRGKIGYVVAARSPDPQSGVPQAVSFLVASMTHPPFAWWSEHEAAALTLITPEEPMRPPPAPRLVNDAIPRTPVIPDYSGQDLPSPRPQVGDYERLGG